MQYRGYNTIDGRRSNELYWLKQILSFVKGIISIEDPVLKARILEELDRQLDYQSYRCLEYGEMRSDKGSGREHELKKYAYAFLYLRKSQRIDVFRNIVYFLPYGNNALESTRLFVLDFIKGKYNTQKRLYRYNKVINRAIKKGHFNTAISLSCRCVLEQYNSLNTYYTKYKTAHYKSIEYKIHDNLLRIQKFFERENSSDLNNYYERIVDYSYRLLLLEESIESKKKKGDKESAEFAKEGMREVNEMILNLKYHN